MKQKYDVIVVGAGIAGISASLSAKRLNKSVLLIDSMYSVGGLATLGLVTYYLPLCDGLGHQIMHSIPEELLKLSISLGAEDEYPIEWLENGTIEERIKHRYRTRFNPNLYSILLEKKLIEEGVDILYGFTVTDLTKENGYIKSIKGYSRSESLEFGANYFIDASGDANLSSLAKEKIEFSIKGNFLAHWFYIEDNGFHKLMPLGSCDSVYNDNEKRESFKGVDTYDLTECMIKTHKGILDNFLEGGNLNEKHVLSLVPSIPEVRMTRKIIGKHMLDYNDDKKYYESSVGLFSYWLKKGPVFELPIEALYGETKNLLVSGRCISVKDDLMWDVTRSIPVCSVSGEACGVIAALSESNEKIDIKKIQKILRDRGIPMHFNEIN